MLNTIPSSPLHFVNELARVINDEDSSPNTIMLFAEAIAAQADAYRQALMHIKQHQEVIGGEKFSRMGSTWQIANTALKDSHIKVNPNNVTQPDGSEAHV